MLPREEIQAPVTTAHRGILYRLKQVVRAAERRARKLVAGALLLYLVGCQTTYGRWQERNWQNKVDRFTNPVGQLDTKQDNTFFGGMTDYGLISVDLLRLIPELIASGNIFNYIVASIAAIGHLPIGITFTVVGEALNQLIEIPIRAALGNIPPPYDTKRIDRGINCWRVNGMGLDPISEEEMEEYRWITPDDSRWDPARVSPEPDTTLGDPDIERNLEEKLEGIYGNSGHIGRAGKSVNEGALKMDIWVKGSQRISNQDVQAKIDSARKLAIDKLQQTAFTEGIPVELAQLAIVRLKNGNLNISAIASHVDSKTDGKESDLFLLGDGRNSQVLIPRELFNFDAEGAQAFGRLARALTHEVLEEASEAFLANHPALAKQATSDAEFFHRFIIDNIEKPAFSEFDLAAELRRIIATKLEENKELDAVSIQAIADEGKRRAAETLAAKVLEFGKSETELQAALDNAFANGAAVDAKQVGAHLLLPSDIQSPLLAQIEQIDAKALIILDAAVLEGLTALPAGLDQAIKSGRIVFFGEPNSTLVPAAAFVKSAAELEARVSPTSETGKNIEKVVAMLEPETMRVAFPQGYGKRTIGSKHGFVAPLNRNHAIPVHVAFANELIRVNFNVRDLSEAGKLLLALQLETIDVSIAEMQDILYELGQIPSEIIRDGKKELQEKVIRDVLQALAA